MSVKALSVVFEDSRATGAAFTVLLALADWADHTGHCYPSYGQMAAKARVSRATAIEAIHDLVALGEIVRLEQAQGPTADDVDASLKIRSQWRNRYRIALIQGRRQVVQSSDPLPAVQGVQPADPLSPPTKLQVVQLTDVGGPIDTAQVVQSTDPHIRSRPSGSPSGRPSENVQAGAAPPPPKQATPEQAEPEPEIPADNIGVITKLTHFAIDQLGPEHEDLTETVKSLCAQYHIPYDSAVVRKAIDSALWQRGPRSALR